MTRLLAPALALLLLGCASTPSRTVLVRAYLGASEEGGYAWAQAGVDVGVPPNGTLGLEGADAATGARTSTLTPTHVAVALDRATAAGDHPTRTAEESLAPLCPTGYSPARGRRLVAGSGAAQWSLSGWAPLPSELRLSREEGELQLRLRLEGGDDEVVVFRLAEAGRTWLAGVELLPARPGRLRALALTGAASVSGSALYRLEGLSELDLTTPLANLLGARAIRAIERGELDRAEKDLRAAVDLDPQNATAHYNLACTLALAERLDEALLSLGRAVELAPAELLPLAATDPDLAALRERVEFQLMVEPRMPGRER